MPYLLLLSALFCNVFLAITDKQSSGYINSRQIVFFSFHKIEGEQGSSDNSVLFPYVEGSDTS